MRRENQQGKSVEDHCCHIHLPPFPTPLSATSPPDDRTEGRLSLLRLARSRARPFVAKGTSYRQ
eukprot:5829459-Pyramimonas_sp.AAC.1